MEPIKIFVLNYIAPSNGVPQAGLYRNIPALVAHWEDKIRFTAKEAMDHPGQKFVFRPSDVGESAPAMYLSFETVKEV